MEAALHRAGRRDTVQLVAVSKTVSAERIHEAYEWGIRHFGENRVQELEAKRAALDLPEAVWHMVGHLQRNKASRAVELFARVDSVDSFALAEKLAADAREQGRTLPILLEVHLGDEPTKHGLSPQELLPVARAIARLPGLQLDGLMTLPPWFHDPEKVRPFFRQLRELAERINGERIAASPLRELSMGMSADFEVAIEEGATQIRVGTALFGQRRDP